MSTPTITYANFRAIFNRKIGDIPIAVTTTSAGADTTYDTAISTALKEYVTSSGSNDLFADWWCYVPSTLEERRVKSFDPTTGTLSFYRGFTARVATSTAIELHKWQVSKKLLVMNDTLEYVCKDGFYNPSYDETLAGQEGYGVEGSEYDKREYAVPTAFEEFPDRIVLLEGYTGTHTGSDAASALTDSTASFKTSELVGFYICNTTDASKGVVTANTSTGVTATLSGGTDNDWDNGDEYIVQKPDALPQDLKNYQVIRPAAGGAFKFYATIPENYVIKLIGKGPLTNFST
ncbi:MAG: hypothetical protein M0R06_25220, partial [Sphaerochaeta sp.]|nr:hypothetical protein [Sphaerochaeta sp.]